VSSLRRDGVAVLQFSDLFEETLWQETLSDVDPFVAAARNSVTDAGGMPLSKGDLILSRFDLIKPDEHGKKRPYPTLPLQSPWIRIGTSEAILDIVNTYRGCLTRLSYLDNWFTVPLPATDERVFSQQWHRDSEDEHVVKVFLYLSDVDAEAGPFEYIKSSATGGRYGYLWPWGESKRYPPPDSLERRVAPEDFFTGTGAAGTLIMCDTGGFHRGGFARTKPRVLSTWTYVAPGAKKGKRQFKVDDSDATDALAAQARFALSTSS
jgi:hypothetical protein